MTNEETIRHLNDLIEVSRDGENGYRTAAEHVSDSHFQTVFAEYAKQRGHFVRELQEEVKRLGGQPEETGTLTAAVHRGWLDLKSLVTGGSPASIIAACETGDDAAQAAYERVVNLDISGTPRTVIEKQWKQIGESHRRMINLKEEHAN